MSLEATPATTADPFAPVGVTWHPVESRLATVRLLGLACWMGPLIILGIVLSLIFPAWWLIGLTVVAAGLGGWQAWRIPHRVRAMGYAVRDRDLFWRQGLMFRRLTVVPYVRIQYVDMRIGPIERSFGLASVTVSTASPALTTAVVGLTPAAAAELRDVLTNRDHLTGQTTAGPTAQP